MNPHEPVSHSPGSATRREFLRGSLASAAIAATGRPWADAAGAPRLASDEPRRPAARVIRVTSDHVMPVRVPQLSILREMLEVALTDLTDAKTAEDAWRAILKPDDVILLKFNRSGRSLLQPSSAMAHVLTESIVSAGWTPDQLVVMEAGDNYPLARKTGRPEFRWLGRRVDFGSSGSDVFTAAIDQATAIVNIPFLKVHHLAVMTGCMKNLSHGLVRHPAQFHANGCDPAIAEIVASDPIRSRLRLNIVDAIRVLFDLGSQATEPDVHTHGGLIVGRDPAACDAVGFSIINEIRSLRRMQPVLKGARLPRQLVSAARLGVGNPDISRMDLRVHDFKG